MAEVELRGVGKTFPNGFQALHDLSLKVADGEFLVLVGPSGCGKSTALNIVAGLEACTTGDVRVGDRVVTHEPPKRRDVAMVFQDYALYPHMTVARNIGFPLELAKVSKSEIRTRVAEAARILDLQAQLGKKPGQLSGGQKQRVAMGRAIVRRPSVFLMDEPLSNLDAKLRVQMRTEIARLQAELEVTTIYVTHDQVEAMTMGDRVAVMLDGRLQQLDTPKSLYANPRNLFVAGFIGSPAMNLLRAIVARADEGAGIVLAVGSQALPVGTAALDRFGGVEPVLARGEVALGIRPEHLTLADGRILRSPATQAVGSRSLAGAHSLASVPAVPRRVSSPLKGTVVVVEELGADLLAHVRIDAAPVQIVDTVAGEAAREELAPSAIDRDTAVIVARLGADADVSKGQTVDLDVDVGRIHLFDLATTESLTARPGDAAAGAVES
jgi:multiple sugar transport system ATP-binding protein